MVFGGPDWAARRWRVRGGCVCVGGLVTGGSSKNTGVRSCGTCWSFVLCHPTCFCRWHHVNNIYIYYRCIGVVYVLFCLFVCLFVCLLCLLCFAYFVFVFCLFVCVVCLVGWLVGWLVVCLFVCLSVLFPLSTLINNNAPLHLSSKMGLLVWTVRPLNQSLNHCWIHTCQNSSQRAPAL